MNDTILQGSISFVNYEKNFATIDYELNAKKKSVNCKTDEKLGSRKPHYFRIGDQVRFQLKLSDRGDKMTAWNVEFLYNTALEQLINKAATENRFSGYLKIVEDKYFVKEWDSYIFFPLVVSPWEKPPVETADNEAISFKLNNLDKPNAISAELFSHNFTPAYRKAMQHFDNQINAEAVVARISPHSVYVDLFEKGIQAKLQLTPAEKEQIKEGDTLDVLIAHLTLMRVVVKKM